MADSTSTFAKQINDLAVRVGKECRLIYAKIGSANLTTTEKTTLIGAINELDAAVKANDGDIIAIQTALTALQTTVSGLIDDTAASTTKVYSSSKVDSQITAAKQAVKNDLLGGAGEAYDTLKELADLIETNKTAIEALQTIAAGHVKYNAAQSLTDEQKAQARTNIGAIAASDVNLTEVNNSIAANTTAINGLKTNLGDLNTDFVAAFEAELAKTE